jgi:hypothetical protein
MYGWCDCFSRGGWRREAEGKPHRHQHVLDILDLLVPSLTVFRFVEKLGSGTCSLTGIERRSIHER